jgi:glutamine amidotransferase
LENLMPKSVIIPDYGVGNLYSVARAVEKAGGKPVISQSLEEVIGAERLILPGVGAFASCIGALRASGMVEPLLEFIRSGRPFLGICVGMQLLFDYSLEFGRHDGLGLIAGHVGPIPTSDAAGTRRVPHVGWSPLSLPEGLNGWEDTLFEGARPEATAMYFVHSYSCLPANTSVRIAEAEYNGFRICAALQRENISAIQCHPERSGPSGLRLFANFLAR